MTRTIGGEPVRPQLQIDVQPDYPRMAVAEDAPVVRLARAAARAAGQELTVKLGGGGSDANIFNAHGIATIILATGMRDVHSPKESVAVDDMVDGGGAAGGDYPPCVGAVREPPLLPVPGLDL